MRGQYPDAIESLIKAHLAARESIRCLPNDYTPLRSSCDVPQEFSLLDQIMLASSRPTPIAGINHTDENDESIFIYNRPISIPAHLQPESQETHAIISISILFNLALAQHLRAMEFCPRLRQQERSELAARALKLYRLAFQLHHSHQEDEMAFGYISRPSNMLLLALMNNSGHTYYMLGDGHDSGKCFEHLFASLMWLRSTSWWETRAESRAFPPETIFAGFLRTTSTWLLRDLPEVAAAAA